MCGTCGCFGGGEDGEYVKGWKGSFASAKTGCLSRLQVSRNLHGMTGKG